MARVKLIEPATGLIVEADEKSPQAKAWKRAEPVKAAAPKPSKSNSDK